ncbi:unnamed protein product, partial [Anisakis simplex]|uniref:Transposase n=1 Tax=Anisakis simplex TaxID=6269 RepID=A0A0M3J4U4_ANISI
MAGIVACDITSRPPVVCATSSQSSFLGFTTLGLNERALKLRAMIAERRQKVKPSELFSSARHRDYRDMAGCKASGGAMTSDCARQRAFTVTADCHRP